MNIPRLPVAVIFDLDGVVAETEDVHRQAYNVVFDRLGMGIFWCPDDYRAWLPKTAGTKWYDLPMPDSFADRETFKQQAYALKRQAYLQLLRDCPLPARPGVWDLLETLKQSGVAIGAASTSAKEAAESILDYLSEGSIRPYFQVVCAGDDVDQRKPAPDIYLLAARMLGVNPSECVAIEDTRHGMQSALAAGMKCVVTPSEYTVGDEFPEADLVVPNLVDGAVTPERLGQLWKD